MHKRRLIFPLLMIIIISLFISCRKESGYGIESGKGVITLRNYDFHKNIIPLDYEWEFYWKQLYTPEDFEKIKPAATGLIKLPGVWNGYNTGSGIAGGDGFATFRFTVKNIPAGSYGLKIPSMATAYRLWVNRECVSSNGSVAPGGGMVPQQLPAIALFNTSGEDLAITVQVSNYMSDKGGIWGSIYFGSADQIIRERVISVGTDLLLFGCLLIMSLYHLCFYSFRRRNRFILYFGIICSVMALRVILTGEFFLVYLIPGINWNFEIRLEFITIVAGFTLFLMFIRELYSNEFPGSIIRFYQAAGIVFTLIIMIIPLKSTARLLPVYHLIIVSGLIYIIYTLINAVRNRRDGAQFILAGCIVLILVIINDILDSNNIIHTGYLFPYGVLFLIFAQSVILSGIFSSSLSRVEELSGQLQASYNRIDEYNRNLETMIEARTSELSEANLRLRDLDHAKTDFFANISHEFRTPLSLMLAPIDDAMSGKKLNSETLVMMYRNGRNLLSLINDLLDISRITAGRMTLELAETDIVELVRQCCGEMESSAKLKNIDLVFIPCATPVSLYIDPQRIAHVISNFFSNSFKFTKTGGRIEVTVSSDADHALIKFSDTGCGIEADKLEMIFERFSQADTSLKRKFEGTGIGLSIVKDLVELHGGEVSVESRHIDEYPHSHGTTFTVRLLQGRDHYHGRDYAVFTNGRDVPPVVMPYVRGIESDMGEPEQFTTDISEDPTSILVVEDNEDLRRLLVKMLRGSYMVYEASNGQEAVKLLDENEEIDLVLSDIMMPYMDGHELIMWIRADQRFEGLPVVFLTARAESYMKIEGLDLGAIDYVTKPFNSDELILRIRNQIELKRLRNSLHRNYEYILAKLKTINVRSVSSDNVSKIDGICAFIGEHYMQDLKRDHLAAAVGLNPDTFSRLFNQHTGSSLFDYVNELRIREAMKRLARSDETITRICIDAGFDNIRTFNRVFKKITGVTPGEYRERRAVK